MNLSPYDRLMMSRLERFMPVASPKAWYQRPEFWVQWGAQVATVGVQGVTAAATNDPQALAITAIIGSLIQVAMTVWQVRSAGAR